MEIWHLKDVAQIVLLVLTFGQRIYSVLVISLVKHPSRPFSFPSVQTEQRSPSCQKESRSGGKKKTTHKKDPFWGSKENTWSVVASGIWLGPPPPGVVLVVPCMGRCNPGCSSSGVGYRPGHRAGVTSERR